CPPAAISIVFRHESWFPYLVQPSQSRRCVGYCLWSSRIMKKLFSFLAALLFVGTGYAQTFPVQNLQVNGTATFASPVAVAGPATFASSVAVTGNLTAPTPTIPDSSSKVATTDFVSKTAPCPSVLAYGGDNTFTNDNAAAFAAAAAANPTGNVCVYFPPGKYKFATNVAYTLPTTSASITVQGAGSDVSILAWTNGGGLTITSQSQNNSQHIRNLTFTTQGTGVGNGLTLQSSAASNPQPDNSAFSDISGVTFRGDDGYDLINYGNVALSINGTSNINLINDRIQGPTNASGYTSVGTGVVISGTSAQLPVVFNFSSCTMNDIGTAILVAAPMQGMSVTQSNFVGGTYGILVNAGLSNFAEMTVMASQFNVANTAILTNTAVPN